MCVFRPGKTVVRHQHVIVVLLLLFTSLISAGQRTKQGAAREALSTTLFQVSGSPKHLLHLTDHMRTKVALVYRSKSVLDCAGLVSCRLGSRFARQTSLAAEMASI